MAKKTTKNPLPSKKQDAPAVDATAAPPVEGIEDLTEVESAISNAQRAAGELADGVDDEAVEEIAGAVAKAEAASPGDDTSDSMDEIVSALEEVERSQTSAGLPTSLKEYDRAIAGAVDDMLDGDFVSVDLVLEGMNETTPPPAASEVESASETDDEHSAEIESPQATVVADAEDGLLEGDVVDVATVVSNVTDEEQAMLEGDILELGEVSDAAAPEPDAETEPEPVAVAAKQAPDDEPAAPRESAPSANASPAKAQTEAPAEVTPSFADSILSLAGSALPVVRTSAMTALTVMSIPMKLIPPKARDIVDWVALSLIFWVPIVWFFALFIVG